MTSGVDLVIHGNRSSFEVDTELLKRWRVHDLGDFSGSEVLFVCIVHPADEAMVGDQFTRAQSNDVGRKRAILYTTNEGFGVVKFGGTLRVWWESVGPRNATSTKASHGIKNRCSKQTLIEKNEISVYMTFARAFCELNGLNSSASCVQSQ